MAGIKVILAKQALVRYIREMNLKPGDRLPPQATLRDKLKLGTTTISSALYELQADRVVEIQDKVGVFVLDPEADGHIGRRIGLAINALEVSAFRCCMSNLLQNLFAKQGWQVIPFFCDQLDLCGKMAYQTFPGLKRSVKQKEIEALVALGDFSDESLAFFASHKLPFLFVGALETESSRVVVDMSAFLLNAFEKFAEAGIKYPAIVIPEALKAQLEPIYERELQNFPETKKALLLTGNFMPDGAQAAKRILELAPDERPDGIAIFDDTLASSFCAELARQRSCGYQPRMAILEVMQNPMDFAADKIFAFYVDQKFMAKRAVMSLGNMFRGKQDEVVYHVPAYVQNSAVPVISPERDCR